MLDFRGKRVLVMGLGLHGGGVGTVKFLAKNGARITVTDLRNSRILGPALKELKNIRGIKYVLGRHRKEDFLRAQHIIKNPGIRPSSPYLKLARKNRIPITSDVGIFFEKCSAPIIGVTGTRGKSTTAYLIWKFLKTKKRRIWLAGNIRKSALEILPHIKKGDFVVLELSSFQLQDMAQEKKSPQIAVLTNILLDHLNWHKNFQEYVKAKSYIFKFQKTDGLLFFNPEDPKVRALAKKTVSQAVPGRLPKNLWSLVDSRLGTHYRLAVGLAVTVARHLGILKQNIKKALLTFRGLPGRQEEILIKKGVHFINDTTATTPDAAIAAIKRFKPLTKSHKLILIAGGTDKKLRFQKFAAEIKKSTDALILLPGTATKQLKMQMAEGRWQMAKTMDEAVRKAWGIAQKGDYAVLSPGAASFGLFLNEFDRGDQFIQAIKRLR